MVSKNQTGFHLVAIVLVILVLSVAGVAAWRVFKTSSKNQPTTNQSAATAGAAGKISQVNTAKLAFDQKAAVTDPIGDKNGPFYHNVHTAASVDGLRFSGGATQILNHASVPDAIKLPSGQLVIYAVDGAARSKSGVLVAVSGDQGKTWSAGSMQLSSSRTGSVADPQITLSDTGQLRLYYVVFPAPPTAGQPPTSVNKVYSATSNDGINFSEESGVRFEYGQITDPDVIKIGSLWFLYAAQGPRQIYATSDDGTSFSYKGITRQNGAISKTVALSNGGFRQFYCAKGISSSTTTDGLTWVDEGVNLPAPAGQSICDPSPLQLDDNSWLMVYKLFTPSQ